MKKVLVIVFMLLNALLVASAFAYTGSVDFPDLFKYSDQKNTNLETALLSISTSFKDNSIPITQELLAAIMATLDKEVGASYLPVEEMGDYGMGPDCTYKIGGSCRSTPYEGGVDYKGRGYIQITGKSNYQTYCGSDCVGASTPELDVCGCKNQWQCTDTNTASCPQAKALQSDYAARIFALYYVNNNLVSLSNAKSYRDVGKAINGGEAYASDFNNIANAYLTLFSDNPDKTSSLLIWLNSGTSGTSTPTAAVRGASNSETQQPASQVTLNLYVHAEDANGPVIPGATVTGHDGSGNNFQQTTKNNGYVTIEGSAGTWSFSASASGYEINNWDQDITDTCTRHAFLQKEETQQESVVATENSVVGKWRIYTSWDCSDSDVSEPMIISFNADGTLIYADDATGNWEQDGNNIRWSNDAKYENNGNSGTCRATWIETGERSDKDSLSGVVDCNGVRGCWYAVRVGSKGDHPPPKK